MSFLDQNQNEIGHPILPASSIDCLTDDEFDKLLELQTRKSELIQKRELLSLKKSQLTEETMALQTTLADYTHQKLQQETKKKLDFFLHQNDHESAKLSAPDHAAAFVLENLDMLTPTDWTMRRKLLNKFHPNLSFSKVETSRCPEDETAHFFTFKIAGYGVPQLTIRVRIKDEAVIGISVLNWNNISSVLHKISPSLYNAIKDDYIPGKKLDLFIYTYGSLARVQHQRIRVFSEILEKHDLLVTTPPKNFNWLGDPMNVLLTLSYIEVAAKSYDKPYLLRLLWTPTLKTLSTGELKSNIRFSVLNHDLKPVKTANDVFKSLVADYGVSQAFTCMVSNLFEKLA